MKDTYRAVVLLSGGLDSATALGIALNRDYEVYPLTVNYNQRHAKEIEHAQRVVAHYMSLGAEIHPVQVVHVSSIGFEGSALTNPKIDVPKDRDESTMAKDIPVTYVPCRNTVLLGLAASYAESLGTSTVFVGFNAVDYSGYPDCRPEYVRAMTSALRIGSTTPFSISAPIISDTKVEIVRRAIQLGVPLKYTWSCYSGLERPCGHCDSCIIRADAFRKVGVEDPAL